VVTLAILLAGCDGLWLDTYWRSERYVLLAVDSRTQMSLSVDMQDGTGLALVGPTVFSIGGDANYIVIKQHPSTDALGSSFDRGVTNYYVVTRSRSPRFAEREKGVRGPMTEAEFTELKIALQLPAFTKTFEDLK
jgi:hypothetical protein